MDNARVKPVRTRGTGQAYSFEYFRTKGGTVGKIALSADKRQESKRGSVKSLSALCCRYNRARNGFNDYFHFVAAVIEHFNFVIHMTVFRSFDLPFGDLVSGTRFFNAAAVTS